MVHDLAVQSLSAELAAAVTPIAGVADDYDELIEIARHRRVVLIGEASHGTHEFYRERARITKRLINECGFNAVAIEGDFPDAYRVNRYVMGLSDDASADVALSDFRRFPAWMWRNRDMVEFTEWLRARNVAHLDARERTRVYGLDLYSLRASMEAVVDYLDRVDPAEAARARQRYSCFDHIGADGQAYGFALAHGGAIRCEAEVVEQLIQLRRRSARYLSRDGWVAADEQFFAEQNALVVRDAEEYYQQMYRAEVSSWNLRDRHMAETLEALIQHLDHQGSDAKVVVWEHNSHVGDARATEMGGRGEFNVGQLARERYGAHALLIGLTTYSGEVTAAADWGGEQERKRVRPARAGSHEAFFHEVALPAWWVRTKHASARHALDPVRLERAIGVIYRPDTERQSHYFGAHVGDQFDVIVHIDRTSALEPLDRTVVWDQGEPAETYPFGV